MYKGEWVWVLVLFPLCIYNNIDDDSVKDYFNLFSFNSNLIEKSGSHLSSIPSV